MNTTQRTFVLVHGAHHGGWCWRRVSDILVNRGHRVFAPTLTGLGERWHLLSRCTDLNTHILDVVNVFEWEDITEAVLCGHSYGGWVVSGALEHVEKRVSSVVFLDAYVPENGQRGLDIASPRSRKDIEEARQSNQPSRPAPGAEWFRVNEKDRAWVDAKMTAQPIGVSLQEIRLTGARDRIARKAYVRATDYPSPTFDAFFNVAKASPGWRTYEVRCGHDVMIDMPEMLADILCEET